MVIVAVALLVEKACNGAAAHLCGTLEEVTEVVCDELEVVALTSSQICVLEFVIAPAESRGSVALRETEHSVVTGIVETAGNLVAGMAVASP